MFDEPIGLGAAPAAPLAASPTLASIVVDSAATPATPAAPEAVAAPQDVVSPGHAGSTCSPAQAPVYRGSMPAQANQQMQMQHAVPVQCGSHLTAAPDCSSISMQLPASPSIPLQQLSSFGADISEMHLLFARLFTPKHPSTLPKSQWLSYTRLFSIVQPYAPARVWRTTVT